MSNFVSNENATTLFTKVKNNFGTQVIEWDDWRTMTKAEKEAIPEAKIINAPGVDDNSGHVNVFKKLWENPNPSADFAAGNVDLSSSDYDFTLWQFKYARNIEVYQYYICEKGKRTIFFFSGTSTGSYTMTTRRDVDSASETTYTLGSCYIQNSNSTRSADNAYLIPIAVYGFKKSIDVTAIISDVSTDARKCMLSDGVRSVGDVIDKGSVTVTGDGVKTYAQLLNELYELADFSKLSQYSCLVRSTSDGNHLCYNMISYYETVAYFTRSFVGTSVVVDSLIVGSSSSSWKKATTTTSTTISDIGSGISGSGEKITLYY